MKLLIQRVRKASVAVEGKTVSEIGRGILAFVGIEKGEQLDTVGALAKKLLDFRIFEDGNKKMNLSIRDIRGEILIVPEFTLAASSAKGTRPSFDLAESPERARSLIKDFVNFLGESKLTVKEGVFGASMEVSILNDGPVTFLF